MVRFQLPRIIADIVTRKKSQQDQIRRVVTSVVFEHLPFLNRAESGYTEIDHFDCLVRELRHCLKLPFEHGPECLVLRNLEGFAERISQNRDPKSVRRLLKRMLPVPQSMRIDQIE